MRKLKLILPLILFFSLNVFASTNTEIRTRDDLKIREDIKVDSYNINTILKTPKVDETEKVYDFANLFSDSEEDEIYNQVIDFNNQTNYDLVVVTIDDNNKSSSSSYADDFYDYNYFGFDSSYSGLLILIDMENRIIEISTSGYAIKMYDDNRIDNIIDNGYSELKNGLYATSMMNMIERASYYYVIGYPKSNDNMIVDGTDVYDELDDGFSLTETVIYSGLLSIIITAIVAVIVCKKSGLKIKKANIVNYLINDTNLQANDRYIRSAITKIPRNTGSSGSSSGRVGGSSVRVGSSGRSHGGGGRRF